MEKINEQLYQANIELLDRNKLLEEDVKKLEKRIDKAIELLKDNFIPELAIKALKGEDYGDNG